MKPTKATAWNVYLNHKKIDTVFYDKDISKDEVKQSLIEHDGYDPNITIKRSKVLD